MSSHLPIGQFFQGAHYTFVSLDALTMKVREDGRTVNVACLIAGEETYMALPRPDGSLGQSWLHAQ